METPNIAFLNKLFPVVSAVSFKAWTTRVPVPTKRPKVLENSAKIVWVISFPKTGSFKSVVSIKIFPSGVFAHFLNPITAAAPPKIISGQAAIIKFEIATTIFVGKGSSTFKFVYKTVSWGITNIIIIDITTTIRMITITGYINAPLTVLLSFACFSKLSARRSKTLSKRPDFSPALIIET